MHEGSHSPIAYLKALTPEAHAAIGAERHAIRGLPLRVGRESRQRTLRVPIADAERRTSETSSNNDLHLVEDLSGAVSREHFEIGRGPEGFFLRDRQSMAGTYVEGALLGGGREGGTSPLRDGDVIVVGSGKSGLVYRFLVAGPPEAEASPQPAPEAASSLAAEVRALRDEVRAMSRKLDALLGRGGA